jgi:hypothetical protein
MEILKILWSFFERDINLGSYSFKLSYFFYFFIIIKLLRMLLDATKN